MQIHWKKESVYMRKDFTWENIFSVHLGFAQSLEFLKSLDICPQIFQTWKKSGKQRLSLEKIVKRVFLKVTISALRVKFFSCWSNLIQSCLYVCSASWKKLCSFIFVKVSIDHSFHNLEIVVLEKVLNFGSKNLYEPCTLTWPPFRWLEHQYGCRDFM